MTYFNLEKNIQLRRVERMPGKATRTRTEWGTEDAKAYPITEKRLLTIRIEGLPHQNYLKEHHRNAGQ